MSEEQTKPAAKSGKSRVVVIVLTSLLVAGAATAGTLYGPRVLGAKPQVAAAEAEAKADEGPPGIVVNFQPIVVDVHDKDGEIHHLKVGIALELAPEKTEDDLKSYTPRAREAAISYLRSYEWEDVTAAKRFDTLKQELSAKVIEAVGKARVSRVLVTDFVAQ